MKEYVRGTTVERLAKRTAAFSPRRDWLPWLAETGRYGSVAGPDPFLLLQPANAMHRAALCGAARRAKGTPSSSASAPGERG
jgi:hypothetical protein